jgi:hypothetical protein
MTPINIIGHKEDRDSSIPVPAQVYPSSYGNSFGKFCTKLKRARHFSTKLKVKNLGGGLHFWVDILQHQHSSL